MRNYIKLLLIAVGVFLAGHVFSQSPLRPVVDMKMPNGSRYTGTVNAETGALQGFGTMKYSKKYIKSKRKEGLEKNQIIAEYHGNWNSDMKQGIGFAIMADKSMQFGRYRNGVFSQPTDADYEIGDAVYGIDLSHWRENIDWDNLALYCDRKGKVYSGQPADNSCMQPVFFIYLKASEGARMQDKTYLPYSLEAEARGIAHGAYHYLRSGSSAEQQAQNFLSIVKWKKGDLPPALDIEENAEIEALGEKAYLDMALKWLKIVEKKFKVRPIIYVNETIRKKYLQGDKRFKKYQFWIPRYRKAGPENPDWDIWQFTQKGQISGHKGNMDINLFDGNYKKFRKFIKRK